MEIPQVRQSFPTDTPGRREGMSCWCCGPNVESQKTRKNRVSNLHQKNNIFCFFEFVAGPGDVRKPMMCACSGFQLTNKPPTSQTKSALTDERM